MRNTTFTAASAGSKRPAKAGAHFYAWHGTDNDHGAGPLIRRREDENTKKLNELLFGPTVYAVLGKK